MRYEQLLAKTPALADYAEHVPPEIEGHFVPQTYDAHTVIHWKESRLTRIGILLSGSFRVLNEFENGNIFMIEMNEPVSFVGEVTLLAGATTTSVTIETVTACELAFLPVADFDLWLHRDIGFLRAVSTHVAQKLYCSSYNRGERLFYSSTYLLLKYLIAAVEPDSFKRTPVFVLGKTRTVICEEMGMTLKTLNRAVSALCRDHVISVCRGKLSLTQEQYQSGARQLEHYLRQNKNGAVR